MPKRTEDRLNRTTATPLRPLSKIAAGDILRQPMALAVLGLHCGLSEDELCERAICLESDRLKIDAGISAKKARAIVQERFDRDAGSVVLAAFTNNAAREYFLATVLDDLEQALEELKCDNPEKIVGGDILRQPGAMALFANLYGDLTEEDVFKTALRITSQRLQSRDGVDAERAFELAQSRFDCDAVAVVLEAFSGGNRDNAYLNEVLADTRALCEARPFGRLS